MFFSTSCTRSFPPQPQTDAFVSPGYVAWMGSKMSWIWLIEMRSYYEGKKSAHGICVQTELLRSCNENCWSKTKELPWLNIVNGTTAPSEADECRKHWTFDPTISTDAIHWVHARVLCSKEHLLLAMCLLEFVVHVPGSLFRMSLEMSILFKLVPTTENPMVQEVSTTRLSFVWPTETKLHALNEYCFSALRIHSRRLQAGVHFTISHRPHNMSQTTFLQWFPRPLTRESKEKNALWLLPDIFELLL